MVDPFERFFRDISRRKDAYSKREASSKGEKMTGIVLSIIIILGMSGGPTGDFNDTGATADSGTVTQSTQNVKRAK